MHAAGGVGVCGGGGGGIGGGGKAGGEGGGGEQLGETSLHDTGHATIRARMRSAPVTPQPPVRQLKPTQPLQLYRSK